ncbi:hypothetical protein COMA1_11256 [Candidatus Nitrospira nitrosa]|uniref:Uncharacterized protein n=1 Tax=Candidatus Nitrospira nitrosa TaxID=1742972 RepID=A0A0S4LAH1_9BACT|nr:hypothetical protein COMA1_11256 [Candidatus Nitrospira nitrosa]
MPSALVYVIYDMAARFLFKEYGRGQF